MCYTIYVYTTQNAAIRTHSPDNGVSDIFIVDKFIKRNKGCSDATNLAICYVPYIYFV